MSDQNDTFTDIDYKKRAEELAAEILRRPAPMKEDGSPTDDQVAKAMVDIVSNPIKAVNTKLSGQIGVKMDTDEKVKTTVDKTAGVIINNALEQSKNDTEKGVKKAVFENNRDACNLIGVDEETVPRWVVRIAKGIQGFWYAIWCVVAFFTVAPIVFLGKKIKIIFRYTWLAMLLALLIYLGITFIPLLLKWVGVY